MVGRARSKPRLDPRSFRTQPGSASGVGDGTFVRRLVRWGATPDDQHLALLTGLLIRVGGDAASEALHQFLVPDAHTLPADLFAPVEFFDYPPHWTPYVLPHRCRWRRTVSRWMPGVTADWTWWTGGDARRFRRVAHRRGPARSRSVSAGASEHDVFTEVGCSGGGEPWSAEPW
jgi:hypothetical protein